MLKWTVKKRFADQQQLSSDVEVIRRLRARRSLGDILTEETPRSSTTKSPKHHRRRSLGSHLKSERAAIDKENHFVTPVRRKSNRQSSTPLSDCGNLHRQNCKRNHRLISSAAASPPPPASPISLSLKEIFVEPSAAIFPTSYAPTLPTFDVEYSPVMQTSQRIVNKSSLEFEELPAKRLKMELLDMSYEFKPEKTSTSSPLSTPLVTRKFNQDNKIALNLSVESKSSMNSSEVGDTTLQQMIDDILASARNGKKFKKSMPKPKLNRDKNCNFMRTLSEVCENMEQKSIEKLLSPGKIAQASDKTIIITEDINKNEREVISPVKETKADHVEETCTLKRQNAVRRKNASNENKAKKKPEESQKSEKDFHDSSIQKCLSFSSANFDDLSDKFKRSSVASNSSSSSSSYISQSKYTKNCLMKGSLEVAISTEENRKKIVIHGEFGNVLIINPE
jgi:Domain of unknown function (DUF4799)